MLASTAGPVIWATWLVPGTAAGGIWMRTLSPACLSKSWMHAPCLPISAPTRSGGTSTSCMVSPAERGTRPTEPSGPVGLAKVGDDVSGSIGVPTPPNSCCWRWSWISESFCWTRKRARLAPDVGPVICAICEPPGTFGWWIWMCTPPPPRRCSSWMQAPCLPTRAPMRSGATSISCMHSGRALGGTCSGSWPERIMSCAMRLCLISSSFCRTRLAPYPALSWGPVTCANCIPPSNLAGWTWMCTPPPALRSNSWMLAPCLPTKAPMRSACTSISIVISGAL
mmetsp:Transcript_27610/g.78115  ORF Transcript_27610/g.78115 Transcript_27610/m.78115 type:complete len:282 (+) Transcript_27610:834-1679(+)